MRGLNKLFAALIVGALFAMPASAIAQSAQDPYDNGPAGVVQDQIDTQPAAAESDEESTPPAATAAAPREEGGELPFTGFDLALVVGAGGVLLLLGFGIRRFTRVTEAV